MCFHVFSLWIVQSGPFGCFRMLGKLGKKRHIDYGSHSSTSIVRWWLLIVMCIKSTLMHAILYIQALSLTIGCHSSQSPIFNLTCYGNYCKNIRSSLLIVNNWIGCTTINIKYYSCSSQQAIPTSNESCMIILVLLNRMLLFACHWQFSLVLWNEIIVQLKNVTKIRNIIRLL